MIKLREDFHKTLHELGVSYKDSIEINRIQKGEKISILSDSMLKTMFQNENRIKYSVKLISYYVDISYEELLKNIYLAKNELDKNNDSKKGEKCDYVALINDTSINIEVNNNGSLDILERNMEYAHRLYSRLVRKGKNNGEYTQVIQFNLNNFSFNGVDKIVDIYSVQNDDLIRSSNKLIFVQIYIPNLIRKWYTLGIQKLSESERYLLTLVLRNIDEAKEVGKGVKIMEEYIEDAVDMTLDEDLRESYDKEWAMEDLGMQRGYELGIEKGMAKGIEDGMKDGIEKGMKDGIEKGMKDGIEKGMKDGIEKGIKENKIEVAKKMKEDNTPIDLIAKYTELTKKEIENL